MVTNVAAGVRAFTSNAFLVAGERTVLVDAGANFDAVSAVEAHVDDLDALVLTHTHEDHVGNVAAVADAFGVDVWGFDPGHEAVDEPLADDESVRLGDDAYVALHTPGHKDDHLCLYSRAAGVLFSGDLVFANGGFGRTDLPGGDRGALVDSVEYVLDRTDERLREMHAGHGPSVTRDPYRHVEMAARAARTY